MKDVIERYFDQLARNALQTQVSEASNSPLTLGGFKPDNSLRTKGDLNFYVNSPEYGFVELTLLSLNHSILDISMGWTNN